MSKFYRVVKDHSMWEVGAILSVEDGSDTAHPISDLWNKHDFLGTDWGEGTELVEKSDFFERVYETNWLGKQLYVSREKAREMAAKLYKDK